MPPTKKQIPKTAASARRWGQHLLTQKENDQTMAKKKATGRTATAAKPRRPKQQKIAGTFDPIPADLQEKVDEYVTTLRERMSTQKEEDVLRAEVLELMRAHDIEKVPLEEEQKDLVLEHGSDSIKIKKRKTPKKAKDSDESEED